MSAQAERETHFTMQGVLILKGWCRAQWKASHWMEKYPELGRRWRLKPKSIVLFPRAPWYLSEMPWEMGMTHICIIDFFSGRFQAAHPMCSVLLVADPFRGWSWGLGPLLSTLWGCYPCAFHRTYHESPHLLWCFGHLAQELATSCKSTSVHPWLCLLHDEADAS